MTGLIKEAEGNLRDTGKRPCVEDGGRDWSIVDTRQGALRANRSW